MKMLDPYQQAVIDALGTCRFALPSGPNEYCLTHQVFHSRTRLGYRCSALEQALAVAKVAVEADRQAQEEARLSFLTERERAARARLLQAARGEITYAEAEEANRLARVSWSEASRA